MTRWRGAFSTAALLALMIGAIGIRTTPVERAGSQTSVPSPAVTAALATTAPSQGFHSTTLGFDVRLPRGWTAADESALFNRRSIRLLVIGNRGTDVPYPASTTPLPGQSPDWHQLASDRIVLELVMFSGPLGPSLETESSFPLEWASARPIPDGTGSSVPALSFQHMLRSLSLIAHIGVAAPASDVSEINGIVASLTPEPIPAGGEYRGWTVLGPLASFPVGAVAHFTVGPSRAYGFFLVRGTRTIFAFLDSAYWSVDLK